MRDWAFLALAVIVLLSTLGLVRKGVSMIRDAGADWVLRQGVIFSLVAVGLGILIWLIFVARVKQVRTYASLFALGFAYALILWKLSTIPVERVHLLEYGLIGILAHRAVGHHAAEPGRTLLAVLVCLNIGLVDELVQGLLPSRFYDTKDVLTNAAAGLLGVLSAAVIRSASPPGGAED